MGAGFVQQAGALEREQPRVAQRQQIHEPVLAVVADLRESLNPRRWGNHVAPLTSGLPPRAVPLELDQSAASSPVERRGAAVLPQGLLETGNQAPARRQSQALEALVVAEPACGIGGDRERLGIRRGAGHHAVTRDVQDDGLPD